MKNLIRNNLQIIVTIALISIISILADINYFLNGKSIHNLDEIAYTIFYFIQLQIDNFKALNFYPIYWTNRVFTGEAIHTGLSIYNPFYLLLTFFNEFSHEVIFYDILLRIIGGTGIYCLLKRYKFSFSAALCCALLYPLNSFYASIGIDPQFADVIFFSPWIIFIVELIIENLTSNIHALIFTLLLSLALSICYLSSSIQLYTYLLGFLIFPYLLLRIFIANDDITLKGVNSNTSGSGAATMNKRIITILSLLGIALVLHLLLVAFEFIPTLHLFSLGYRPVTKFEKMRIIFYPFSLFGFSIVIRDILRRRNFFYSYLIIFSMMLLFILKGTINEIILIEYLKDHGLNLFLRSLISPETLIQLFMVIFILLKIRINANGRLILFYITISYYILTLISLIPIPKFLHITSFFPQYDHRYAFIPNIGVSIGLAWGIDYIRESLNNLSNKSIIGKILSYKVLNKKHFLVLILILIILPLENTYVYLNKTILYDDFIFDDFKYLKTACPEYSFLSKMKPTERMVEAHLESRSMSRININNEAKTPKLLAVSVSQLIPSYFGANTFAQGIINNASTENTLYYFYAVPDWFGIDYRKPLSPLVNLGGVKYIFSYHKINNNDLRLLMKGDAYYIYENMKAFPRVMLFTNIKYVNKDDVLSVLKDQTNEELLKTVYLRQQGGTQINQDSINLVNAGASSENNIKTMTDNEFVSSSGSVKITRYENEYIEVDCKITRNCFFMITDTFYDEWRAFIGDNEQEIIRSDYNYRGLKLHTGNYKLIMKYYSPRNFYTVIISFITLILVITLLIFLSLKSRSKTK